MVDGVKIRIHGPAMERIRNHPLLTFTESERPGLYTATHGAFTFTGNSRVAWLFSGSIHVHHQGANWQDFSRAAFCEAVDRLCHDLGLHDAQLTVEGLEFGVNIVPPVASSLILDNVRSHRTALARRMGGGEAEGVVIRHGKDGRNYRWKIYDKAHHYGLNGECLRVEIAQRQMVVIRKRCGVRTMADLRSPEVWADLGALLLERFDELHITEPYLNPEGLRPPQLAIVHLAEQPAKWVAQTNAARCRKAKALEGIYARYASPRIRPSMRESIEAKLRELNTTDLGLPVTISPGVVSELPVTNTPGVSKPLPVTETPLMINGDFVTGRDQPIRKGEKVPVDAFEGLGVVIGHMTLGNAKQRGIEVEVPEFSDAVKRDDDTDQAKGFCQTIKRGRGHDSERVFLKSIKETAGVVPAGTHSDSVGTIPGPPCVTCGRSTGSTRKGSKFCSATVYGEREAKKCRNADSNRRHNRAASLARITTDLVLFDQTRFIVGGIGTNVSNTCAGDAHARTAHAR